MVRERKLAYISRAGVEIGMVSTKAFTTQLAGLYLLTLALAQTRGKFSAEMATRWLQLKGVDSVDTFSGNGKAWAKRSMRRR